MAGWSQLLEQVASLLRVPIAPPVLAGFGASIPSFIVAWLLAFILSGERRVDVNMTKEVQ